MEKISSISKFDSNVNGHARFFSAFKMEMDMYGGTSLGAKTASD